MDFSFLLGRGRAARRIKDLSADEIARETTKQFKHNGWGSLAGRLLYRGLELNPRHVDLLIGLSAYFNDEPHEKIPSDHGILSGLILDYALSLKDQLKPEERRVLEVERLKLMWKWGLAQNAADRKNRVGVNFEDPSQFDVDEVNFIKVLVHARAGRTMQQGFAMAHIRAGLRSGALTAKNTSPGNPPYDSRDYRESPTYQNWLLQDVAVLARKPG
jgi:hypothetical protein